MKRVIGLLLAICLVFSIVACSKKPETKGTEQKEADSIRVVLIGNQRFGDSGPMDDMASGGERAAKDFGVEFKKIESQPASFEEDIRGMAEEGYDLILTTFFYMSEATKLVAQEYPDTKFAAIFQSINEGDTKVDNLWDAVFSGQETFYVNGCIAGLSTKTNRVGFIVGGEEPGPHSEANGFMRGVRDVNPNATVEFGYADYEDSAKAKEVAIAMIEKGCDIIQGDNAAPDAGIVEAAEESGKDVYMMSCIMDFSDSDRYIGTIKMNYGTAVYDAIKWLVEGNFPGGTQGVRNITNDGYYLFWEAYDSFPDRAFNKEYGDAVAKAVVKGKEIEQKLLKGEITVPFDPAPPSWSRILSEKTN